MKWFFAKILVCSLGLAAGDGQAPLPFHLNASYVSALEEQGLRWEKKENLDEKSANAFVAGKLQTLRDLVHPQADPYTGKVGMPERCRAENLPRLLAKNNREASIKVFSLYSSANFVLGSCPERGARKTQQIFLYCRKSRALYLVSAFFKAGAEWPGNPRPSCVTVESSSPRSHGK